MKDGEWLWSEGKWAGLPPERRAGLGGEKDSQTWVCPHHQSISLRMFGPPHPRKWGASRAWGVGERAVTTRGHCKGNYFWLGRCQLLALPFPSPPGNPLGLLPQMYWYFPSSWFQAALLGRANIGPRRQGIERESPLGFCLTAGTQQGNPT